MNISANTYKIGLYSSLTAGMCTVLFALFLIAGISADTINFSCAVCLIQAVAYVVLANVLYTTAAPDKKVWARISASLAIIYTVYVCMVYYTQIIAAASGSIKGDAMEVTRFAAGSWLFAPICFLVYRYFNLKKMKEDQS